MGVPPTPAQEFLDALARQSRVEATDVLIAARIGGASIATIVDDIVAPAMREVGCRWARRQWSVAEEHAATVIADVALSVVTTVQMGPRRGWWVSACVTGDWHALPVRMVSEVLAEQGWRITFLGASIPAPQLEEFLVANSPDGVLLGASMASHLPAAAACVQAARRAGLPALLGGAGASAVAGCAEVLGAHVAPDGRPELDDLLAALVGQGPRAEHPVADGAARCEAVLARRLGITLETTTACDRRLPGLSDEQSEVLYAASGHLVDALAAALLLDEPAVLDGMVDWLDDAVRSRGPSLPVKDTVRTALHEAAHRHVPALAGTRVLPAGAVDG